MHFLDLFKEDEYIIPSIIEEILDYLSKHKVITKDQFDDISVNNDIKDQNIKLLKALSSNLNDVNFKDINVIGLFANALRLTGCHSLANKIDIDDPAVASNSRRKGQISLIIQVSALQIKIKELLDKQTDTSIRDSIKSVWVRNVEQSAAVNSSRKKRRFSFFSLCCGIERKKKPKKFKNINNNDPLDLTYDESKQKKCRLNSEIMGMHQMKIDILTEKSMDFYNALNGTNEHNSHNVEWENLVKYLEQKRNVLVFDRKVGENSMIVTLICTTNRSLLQLKHATSDGTLEKEITSIILTPHLLDYLDVKNLRLSISLCPEDVKIAQAELTSPRRSMVFC